MRFVFCFFLLIWGCREKTSSTTPTQTEATTVTDEPIDSTPVDVPLDPTLTITEEFMELINDHRQSIGLDPLLHVNGLGEIAEGHSEDMAKGIVAFGHTGFSSRCSAGRAVLGGGNLCAENVATGQKTVKAAFSSWMNSSGHRANIENDRLTHTGFGYSKSSSGVMYWTQIFLERN